MSKVELTIILFLSSVLFAGCAGVDKVVYVPSDVNVKKKHHKIGPPPHAPAHGYRYKNQHGVELEYDSEIGAYIVVGLPDTYFHNGLYLRVSLNENWVVAANSDGPWLVAKESDVPPQLKKSKGKDKSSNKGKKNKKW